MENIPCYSSCYLFQASSESERNARSAGGRVAATGLPHFLNRKKCRSSPQKWYSPCFTPVTNTGRMVPLTHRILSRWSPHFSDMHTSRTTNYIKVLRRGRIKRPLSDFCAGRPRPKPTILQEANSGPASTLTFPSITITWNLSRMPWQQGKINAIPFQWCTSPQQHREQSEHLVAGREW